MFPEVFIEATPLIKIFLPLPPSEKRTRWQDLNWLDQQLHDSLKVGWLMANCRTCVAAKLVKCMYANNYGQFMYLQIICIHFYFLSCTCSYNNLAGVQHQLYSTSL